MGVDMGGRGIGGLQFEGLTDEMHREHYFLSIPHRAPHLFFVIDDGSLEAVRVATDYQVQDQTEGATSAWRRDVEIFAHRLAES